MTTPQSECLKDTVTVLINAAGDTDDSVNNSVIKALTKIAYTYPNEVIGIFCEIYKNTIKSNPVQLGSIVNVLEQTCVNQVKKLEPPVASNLVTSMLRAMTENVAYEPVVQMGASAVLVAVGHENLDLVLRALINQLSPASVPHYTIVHTLGTLAAVNTHGVVPHIKEILSKLLPLLSLIKNDGLKQAFAYAFGHFAVAVSEQIGDNVQNDNITSIKDNFVTEFTIIFDVLYNQWLPSSEPKVSESVLEALGPITRLISERQFNETVNKFVLSLLGMYRKQNINQYYISQCISYLLSQSPLNPKLCLNDNVITSVNHALFNLVVLEPDYDQPQLVKNHFEVLRCFDHMAGQFEQTIEGLLHQCKNNQEKDRMKAVIILTHLTTSSQVFVDNYSTKFISILKVMTAMEPSLKMKKLLAKAIVGLVYRNCITSSEDFAMLEFIIKHCGFEGAATASKIEVSDLQDTCRSSLVLMCNTVTSIRSQLRLLLLNALTVEEYTPAIATVSQCLTCLLQNNSDVIDEEQPDKELELKCSPELVFVRCLTHVVDPDQPDKNKHILVFLEEYSGDVHKNLKNAWTVEVQRLLKFVDKIESRDQWHSMLLDLLVAAVEQVNSNKWVELIASLISQQILSKKQAPMIKGVSLQYLAVLSCHMSNAAVVEKVLKIILLALKSIPMEGCDYISKATGIAARQHGEFVLNELDSIYKENESRKGSKILNFLSSRNAKTEQEFGIVKYAIITCYGTVASECLDVYVLARLGDNVTSILYDILKSSPPFELCKASITTLYHIAKALHPAAHHNVTLRNRWQLLNAVLEQIYNSNLDKKNVELYPIIVKASKALTKLQKGILPEERNTILRVLFNSIFTELSVFKQRYEIDGKNGDKNDALAKTLNDSLTILNHLIRELIIQSTCLSTIDDLVSLLIEWLRHKNDEIRTSASLILQVILETYIKNVKLNYETPSKFGQMGYLLGLTIPGIADTNFPIRLTTIDCVKLIIQIQDLYEGHTIEPDDECMRNLSHLQNNVLTNDLSMLTDYCMFLCDTIAPKIPHHHTMQFIESLFENYDDQELRSAGISAVLDAFVISRGQDLYQSVERIVEVMLGTMDAVAEEARARLMTPMTSLTRHHSNAVTAVLLAQKLPLRPCVVACWHHLARDEELAAAITDNFLRLMTSVELYEDPYHVTENHIAALQPLTLISALGEMLQEDTMSATCEAKFADLFAVLYTTLACYLPAEPPAYSPAAKGQERFGYVPNRDSVRLSPAKITVATFNAFLERAGCQKVREACSLCLSVEHGDSSTTLAELAPLLGGALSRERPARLAALVTRVAGYGRSPLPPQRAAAAALLADMLNYRCNDNPKLIETVLTMPNERVRAICLCGAANVAQLRGAQRAGALPAALSALSQGIDAASSNSPAENVPLAAIQGLTRLVADAQLDKELQRELAAVSQKIRPFMNTSCAALREGSVRLFGALVGRLGGALREQAVGALPCALLHLCDPNPSVVRASKYTLKQVFKTLDAPKSNELVQTHLLDDGRLYLEQFLAALLRQLADERPADVAPALAAAARYLHAPGDARPQPSLLVGILYAELHRIRAAHPEESQLEAEVTRLARARLLQLVKDPNARVRQNAAVALANLCLVAVDDVIV